MIDELIFGVEHVDFRCGGRAEFVGDHVALVDQDGKFVIRGGVFFDSLDRLGGIGIDADDVDAFCLVVCGELDDPLVIGFDDRALDRKKNDDRAVFAFQVVEGMLLAVYVRQLEILQNSADFKVAADASGVDFGKRNKMPL